MRSSRAILTASLLRSAPPPLPDAVGSDTFLFVSKGKATAAQFRPTYLTTEIPPTNRPFLFEHVLPGSGARGSEARVWVRVASAVRLRVKMAADARQQSTRAFLGEVLDTVLHESAPPLTAPRTSTTGRSTKVAFTVDDEQRLAIQQAASRSSLTVQAFLRSAIEAYLERMLDTEPELFPVDALRTKVVAFPRSGKAAPRSSEIDPDRRKRLQQAAARLGLTAFRETPPPG